MGRKKKITLTLLTISTLTLSNLCYGTNNQSLGLKDNIGYHISGEYEAKENKYISIQLSKNQKEMEVERSYLYYEEMPFDYQSDSQENFEGNSERDRIQHLKRLLKSNSRCIERLVEQYNNLTYHYSSKIGGMGKIYELQKLQVLALQPPKLRPALLRRK